MKYPPPPLGLLGLISMKMSEICRRGVAGSVPAFQPGGPGSIPGGVRNFNMSWDWVCVLCLCSVLCCLRRRP